jgi:hypothetical protein
VVVGKTLSFLVYSREREREGRREEREQTRRFFFQRDKRERETVASINLNLKNVILKGKKNTEGKKQQRGKMTIHKKKVCYYILLPRVTFLHMLKFSGVEWSG